MKWGTKTLGVYSKDVIKAFTAAHWLISTLNHTHPDMIPVQSLDCASIRPINALRLQANHKEKCSSDGAYTHLLTCSHSLRYDHHSLSELCLSRSLLSTCLCTDFVPLYCWPTLVDLQYLAAYVYWMDPLNVWQLSWNLWLCRNRTPSYFSSSVIYLLPILASLWKYWLNPKVQIYVTCTCTKQIFFKVALSEVWKCLFS